MRLSSISVRDFRCYERAAAPLGGGLTVLVGPNGSGKTNMLEAVYFACTGRSCRTTNDRELIRFGADSVRVEATVESELGPHQLAVGFAPSELKRMTVDGSSVERILDSPFRPLVSVFMPDRLDLIKGAPALRRAHLDQVVAALWPSRVLTRRSYNQSLAQRNALLTRIRAGSASEAAIASWDQQLAGHALALMADRVQATLAVAPVFAEMADRLGLDGDPTVRYRPRSKAGQVDEFAHELAARLPSDLERGYTSHGPHRDELVIARDDRELRTYGSQGQQRLGLLSLLLAERAVIAGQRSDSPVMLLDDVMSELDRDHRAALVAVLTETDGQTLITTTDLEHVPGGDEPGVARIYVRDGVVGEEVTASVARR